MPNKPFGLQNVRTLTQWTGCENPGAFDAEACPMEGVLPLNESHDDDVRLFQARRRFLEKAREIGTTAEHVNLSLFVAEYYLPSAKVELLFRNHTEMLRYNDYNIGPDGQMESVSDAFVPKILDKETFTKLTASRQSYSTVYVLFDCRPIGPIKGLNNLCIVSHNELYSLAEESVWSYVISLWKSGKYVPLTQSESTNRPMFMETVTGSDLKNHFVLRDYTVLQNYSRDLRTMLNDEAKVIQKEVADKTIELRDGLSRLHVVWNTKRPKVDDRQATSTVSIHIDEVLKPYRVPKEDMDEAKRILNLLVDDPLKVDDVLRQRDVMSLIKRTAPEIAELLSEGKIDEARKMIRRFKFKEGEIQRHSELGERVATLMERMSLGDVDGAMEALKDVRRLDLSKKMMPGIEDALAQGDLEKARDQMLEYQRLHRRLDDGWDGERESLFKKFARTRFGKAFKNGVMDVLGPARVSRRSSNRRGGGGGGGGDGSWVSLRWFDFGEPSEEWVRREH
jgi:hypothetical protein